MKTEILFEEKQSLTDKSVQNFFLVMNIVLIASTIISFIFKREANQQLPVILLGSSLITVFLSYLLKNASLITQIKSDGIYVRFFPFHRAFKIYKWEIIEKLFIRNYNPIQEFGGWGVKTGPSGTAFTLGGTTGLQIILCDGTKLLIGTRAADKMSEALLDLQKLNFTHQ